jgi:hypothetical protein
LKRNERKKEKKLDPAPPPLPRRVVVDVSLSFCRSTADGGDQVFLAAKLVEE